MYTQTSSTKQSRGAFEAGRRLSKMILMASGLAEVHVIDHPFIMDTMWISFSFSTIFRLHPSGFSYQYHSVQSFAGLRQAVWCTAAWQNIITLESPASSDLKIQYCWFDETCEDPNSRRILEIGLPEIAPSSGSTAPSKPRWVPGCQERHSSFREPGTCHCSWFGGPTPCFYNSTGHWVKKRDRTFASTGLCVEKRKVASGIAEKQDMNCELIIG